MPVLLKIWPDDENVLKNAKDWVRDSLTNGKGEALKGFAELDIKPGDLALKALPEEDLHAEIETAGMDVNYSPQLTRFKGSGRHTEIWAAIL